MESFFLAASVVTPLLIYMVIGGFIRKLGLVSEISFKQMNEMTFKAIIPFALFFDVYESDLTRVIIPNLFLFVMCVILLIFIVTFFIVTRFIKNNGDAATVIQGIYRSNYVLFGGAIAGSLCADEGIATVAALAALVVPAFNILAVVLFEVMRKGAVNKTGLLLRVFKNPLVDAGILGALFSFLKIPLPDLLASPLKTLGDISTPLALLILGGLLSFRSLVSHRKYLTAAILGRLVVIPLTALIIAVLLGFRNDSLIAVLAVFGAPTAVASAPMAQSMGGNGALAGEIVVMTSLFCIVTIFLFVFTLSGLGLI